MGRDGPFCKIAGMRLRWFEANTCHAKPQVRPGLRTGPDAFPGAVQGTVHGVCVGQLWARSGQVSGLRLRRPNPPRRGELLIVDCSL
jgi:hypothetical protein